MIEKTREVKTVGILHLLGKSYPLIREEKFTEGVTDGRKVWTVIDTASIHDVGDDLVAYNEPMPVMSNAPWLIEFREDKYLVKDIVPDEMFDEVEQEEPPEANTHFEY